MTTLDDMIWQRAEEIIMGISAELWYRRLGRNFAVIGALFMAYNIGFEHGLDFKFDDTMGSKEIK